MTVPFELSIEDAKTRPFSAHPAKRYDFTIIEATKTGFHARASGKGDMTGDVWEIGQRSGKPRASRMGGKKSQPAVPRDQQQQH
ncbi:MAG: hypothetical protein HY901_23205 [Deltaproteobacteria bacterium]|nr:hypothetical protein [Deltaproteobacteria bacterium]